MKRNVKITLIACLVWVFLVMFLTYSRYASNNQRAEIDPEQLREIGALVYEDPVAIQPFELQDQYGQAFTDASLAGKWSLVFFGFTNCPDICPLTMNELAAFYRSIDDSLRADTQVVMVSVDPFRDDTAAIARYMQGFHEDFIGVNGDFAVVSRLARDLFVANGIMPVPAPDGGTPQNFLIDHSGNILIIDPKGQYRGFMDPNIKQENIRQAYEIIRQAL
jgi:protein SCO1